MISTSANAPDHVATSAGDGSTTVAVLTTEWAAVTAVVTLGNATATDDDDDDADDDAAARGHNSSSVGGVKPPQLCGPALVLSSPFPLGGVVFLDSVTLTHAQ